jgi:protein-S-isoprenylcysteine O-methyltransferase Ste14
MTDKREEFAIARYNNQRSWYSRKANLYKKITHIVSASVVVMSVLLPVSTSVLPCEWKFRWVSLVLSLGIGLATGLAGVFRWRELWISYRATEEALKREYSFYMVKSGTYKGIDDPVSEFMNRVEMILSDEHSKWISFEMSDEMAIKSISNGVKE